MVSHINSEIACKIFGPNTEHCIDFFTELCSINICYRHILGNKITVFPSSDFDYFQYFVDNEEFGDGTATYYM